MALPAPEIARERTAADMLPSDRLERVWAWGMAASAMTYVYRPSISDQVNDVFCAARAARATVGLRGAGRSYGDAALNSEEISLDLSRMNRILEWNPQTGVLKAEPGVTIAQIWRYCIEDGWWPYVVPGTMFPTLGGCAAMNIHGKNNFSVGPIGDHILEFELLLVSGRSVRCSRTENSDLFFAAIGGFGMLGCFLTITLRLKRIYSGMLKVTPVVARSLGHMVELFEERLPQSDYLVGWVDGFSKSSAAGRGLVHEAAYLQPADDPAPLQTLRPEYQELPDTVFGVISRSTLWRVMKPFTNNFGVRAVNSAKYMSSRRNSGHTYLQSHVAFAFLLDYLPNWKRAYGTGGLIQYQSFVPAAGAVKVFERQLALCREAGLPPYLGVFKRHRADPFLMTHGLDGYSLALDFKVTGSNRNSLERLTARLDALVLESEGRFYFAKDSMLKRERLTAYISEPRVQTFLQMKRQHDPEGMLQTDLFRRVFGEFSA